MNVKRSAMIMFALLGIVLTLVGLQGTVAGEWTEIAQSVALVIVLIGVLAIVIGYMVNR